MCIVNYAYEDKKRGHQTSVYLFIIKKMICVIQIWQLGYSFISGKDI